MAVRSIDELLKEGVDGRHVLVRSDFNVPLDDDGTKYRGEFEQRLTSVIDEVVAARRSVVGKSPVE